MMVGSEPRDRELERRPGEEMEGENMKEGVPDDAENASCYCGGGLLSHRCGQLCLPCDRHMHDANGLLLPCPHPALRRLSRLHHLRCATSAAFLCSNCEDSCGGEPTVHWVEQLGGAEGDRAHLSRPWFPAFHAVT
ncbi:unnamed protein product [Urochloa humidicola]